MANGTLKVSNIQTSSGSGTITIGQSGETVNFCNQQVLLLQSLEPLQTLLEQYSGAFFI